MNACIQRLFVPVTGAMVFILDRLSKAWVNRSLDFDQTIDLLPFFRLTHIRNTGIAFGLGQNRNIFFIGTTVALIALLLWMARQWQQSLAAKLALALIIGGALGNLYDRIFLGSVVDFLDFFIGTHHWPAFNIADSSICIGAFILLWTQISTKTPSND